MKFTESGLKGAYIIDIEPAEDERGFFARTFCRKEFEAYGLNPNLLQSSISFNKKKGTLRGMHYQAWPHEETKIVRCTMGAIYDVILDLRPDSKSFKQWVAIDLTSTNHRMVYVPQGFAHGFQTLEEDVEVFYQMSECYYPQSAIGLRWNDPAFGIKWPISHPIISARDLHFPDLGQGVLL